jgi:hypothetical protein
MKILSNIHQSPNDILRKRMVELQINTWVDLQHRSGLTRHIIDRARAGEFQHLRLSQIQCLANALEWSLDQLLHQFQLNQANPTLLEQESHSLPGQVQTIFTDTYQNLQRQTFQQLQTLLTQYPTARHIAEINPQLPAKNLTALFRSLDQLLLSWGIEAIGSPWEQVAFDPVLHHPDSPDLGLGDAVYIRFVGYRRRDIILCPAKVSRTLPKGYT